MDTTALSARIIRNGIKAFADARPGDEPRHNVERADAMLYALRHLELEIEALRERLEVATAR